MDSERVKIHFQRAKSTPSTYTHYTVYRAQYRNKILQMCHPNVQLRLLKCLVKDHSGCTEKKHNLLSVIPWSVVEIIHPSKTMMILFWVGSIYSKFHNIFYTFSAFWLRSSVVSVLISLISGTSTIVGYEYYVSVSSNRLIRNVESY